MLAGWRAKLQCAISRPEWRLYMHRYDLANLFTTPHRMRRMVPVRETVLATDRFRDLKLLHRRIWTSLWVGGVSQQSDHQTLRSLSRKNNVDLAFVTTLRGSKARKPFRHLYRAKHQICQSYTEAMVAKFGVCHRLQQPPEILLVVSRFRGDIAT